MNREMKRNELRVFSVVLLVVLSASGAFLSHNTYYTEGEVMQDAMRLLLFLNVPLLALALWEPRIGLWGIVTLGALLLPWQTWKNRKLAVLHEDIVPLVNHLESERATNGAYPPTLDGYIFRSPWVRTHVRYTVADGTFKILYHLDNPGTSYWYSPEGGFGYYGD